MAVSPTLPPEDGTTAAGADAPAAPPPTPPGAEMAPTGRVAVRLRRWRWLVAAIGGAAVVLTVAGSGTGYVYVPLAAEAPAVTGTVPRTAAGLDAALKTARGRQRQLQARLKAAAPRGVYIVVDQTHNRLYLKKDETVLLEAVCSAGSGMVLKESGGKRREWVFDTPRGRFEVLSMAERPVWRKPDWAFVEEGQPIPSNPAARFEYGTLGEYALYFGNGYMIHGTLYERLLGRAVSHGCIRVGRDDLRKVWANARLGMPIFIY